MYSLTTPVAIATIQKLQNFALQPMESSKRYNSVPVRDNCALFAPTPLFLGPGYLMVSLKFFPADPCCHGNEFLDKIDYNSAPVKDNCALLAFTPLFSGMGSPMVSFKFVKDKIGCSRHCYITDNFFLAPTSFTRSEVF